MLFCKSIHHQQQLLSTVSCQRLEQPTNGVRTYSRDPVNGGYPEGTVATFTCNFGFVISGSSRLTCESANWNEEVPTCVRGDKIPFPVLFDRFI